MKQYEDKHHFYYLNLLFSAVIRKHPGHWRQKQEHLWEQTRGRTPGNFTFLPFPLVRQKHKTSSSHSAGHEAQTELMKRQKRESPEEQHMKAEACRRGDPHPSHLQPLETAADSNELFRHEYSTGSRTLLKTSVFCHTEELYGASGFQSLSLFFRFSETAGKHICNSVLIISSAENISQYWISWPLSPLLLFINYSDS